MEESHYGYTGIILRIDLTLRRCKEEDFNPNDRSMWVGGTGFGAKILWEEVPEGVAWNDPENRLVLGTGPLTGTGLNGAGGFSLVGKGPMTNMAGSSQANGYFGAYLKFCGYDAIIFEGASSEWVYLSIEEENVELRDATHLIGKDTFETEDVIRKELGIKGKGASIFSIGPAGENQVRFSCVVGDRGHVASKNGLGAVMGSKRLKAIVALRGKNRVSIINPDIFKKKNNQLFEESKRFARGIIYELGTPGLVSVANDTGALPVKNYTTNIFPGFETLDGKYVRDRFRVRNDPCFACRTCHTKTLTVTEGPYKGLTAPEPEYEIFAAFGPMVGQSDAGAVVYLNDKLDRLGMDGNEIGWIMGFVLEAYEKDILTSDDLDGIEMTWGNVLAVEKLLGKIARREGIGDLLAEGVKRAAEKIGGPALDMAIFAMDGSTPRGHDHRGRWSEMFDTCLSNTSTIEATFGGPSPELLGMSPATDPFSPQEVSTLNAKTNGWRIIDDCLVICRFAATNPSSIMACLNAVTGLGLEIGDALMIGKRIINLLRLFNLRHGYRPELEKPSPRYGSTPSDGLWKGVGIMPHWEKMRDNYYTYMGWDPVTGRPLSETLDKLNLAHMIEK